MSNKNNEIMLNKMYVGDYLTNNIGHEVINLYQADNGNFYVYTLAYGLPSKHTTPETILFARKTNNGKYEILAKAIGLTVFDDFKKGVQRPKHFNVKNGKQKKEEWIKLHKKQKDAIDNNNITYGGVKLYDIFQNNSYKKNNNPEYNDIDLYFTFKAEKIIKAKKTLEVELPNWKSSMTMYLSLNREGGKISYSEKYKEVKDLIDKTENWEDKPVGKVNLQSISDKETNFLEIIHRENDELIFSNLLKYLFESLPKKLPLFMEKVLGINNFSEKYEIKREYKNIDLIIEDEKNIVVIENKIKSDINGKNNNNNENQLHKYKKIIEEERNNRETKYFIFAPNYKKFKEKDWTTITYGKIYEFFKDNQKDYEKIKYFKDILFSLEKHTKPTDNIHEEEMFRRLKKRIKELQNKN